MNMMMGFTPVAYERPDRDFAKFRVQWVGAVCQRTVDIQAILEWEHCHWVFNESAGVVPTDEAASPDLVFIRFSGGSDPVYPVSRRVRDSGYLGPILVVADVDDPVEMVLALQNGVTAWCGPHWPTRAVALQAGSLLFSAGHKPDNNAAGGSSRLDKWLLNPAAMTCTINGRPVKLTNQEFRVLWTLAQKPNSIVPRTELQSALAHLGESVGRRAVDTFVARIRKKLGSQHGPCVRTFHSLGYMLADASLTVNG